MLKNNKAFTLIEMMVVVAIIGVLSSVAYTSYSKYVTKTKINEVIIWAQSLNEQFTEKILNKETINNARITRQASWPEAIGSFNGALDIVGGSSNSSPPYAGMRYFINIDLAKAGINSADFPHMANGQFWISHSPRINGSNIEWVCAVEYHQNVDLYEYLPPECHHYDDRGGY